MTSSKGRGAREDQCSCLDCAISAHMPKKHRSNMIFQITRIIRTLLLLIDKLSFTKYVPQTFEVTIFQIIVKD